MILLFGLERLMIASVGYTYCGILLTTIKAKFKVKAPNWWAMPSNAGYVMAQTNDVQTTQISCFTKSVSPLCFA